MKKQYLMGIDGGGTKTAIVISDYDGCVLSKVRGSGIAIIGIPEKNAMLKLSGLVHEACAEANIGISDITHCGIGLSGVDFPEEHSDQLRCISQSIGLPEKKITLVNDGIVALWGASSEEASAIIQHGTDFTSAWRNAYGNETLFDSLNVGAVADMRKELITLTARMIDGRSTETPLKKSALAHYGITDESSFCQSVYQQRIPRDILQSTPPLIYEAWQNNDPAAKMIIEKVIEDYAETACVMINMAGKTARLNLGGGIINRAPKQFIEILSMKIKARHPASSVGTPVLAPEFGALLIAAYKKGLDAKYFWNKFKSLIKG